jgi:HK97 family phage prohead protease
MEAKMARQATDRVEYRGRSATEAGLSIREADGAAPVFVGHAAKTESRTEIGNPLSWGFYEELAAGCFERTLENCDARFLVDHDTSLLVARQSAGDLRLSLDPDLAVESDLDTEVSYVRDLSRNVQKRRITGMSFGFVVRKDEWSTVDVTTTDEKGKEYTASADLRRITDVDLWEVSAVTFPAYEDTDAALRALQFSPEQLTARMDMVRHAGIDKRMIGRALDLMTELRVGKALSASNVTLLQSVLDQLAEADRSFDPLVAMVTGVDNALDAAQADLSGLLGVADPDANDPDDAGDRAASGLLVPPADHMRAFAARYGLSLPD